MIGELLMEKMIKNNRYNNRLSNLYLIFLNFNLFIIINIFDLFLYK